MNDTIENQISRAEKCDTFISQRNNDLKATPAIAATMQPALQVEIKKTRDSDAEATKDNTGVTETKTNTGEALEVSVFHVASGIASYAEDMGDFVLKNKVETQISKVQGLRDNKLVEAGFFLLKIIADNPTMVPVLATDHNVDAQDIADLLQQTKDYDNETGTTGAARADNVAWGKERDRHVKEMNDILVKIDNKMKMYFKKDRLLYDAWKATYTVDDTGSKSGAVSGTVAAGQNAVVSGIVFDANKSLQVENDGAGPLDVQLTLSGVPVGTKVTVPGGSTVSIKMGTMAANADGLMVTNNGGVIGSYKIRVV